MPAPRRIGRVLCGWLELMEVHPSPFPAPRPHGDPTEPQHSRTCTPPGRPRQTRVGPDTPRGAPSTKSQPSSPGGTNLSLQTSRELYRSHPVFLPSSFALPVLTQPGLRPVPGTQLQCPLDCLESGLASAKGQRRRRRRKGQEGREKGKKRGASKALCTKGGNSCCKIRMERSQHEGWNLLSGLPTWREEGTIG